MNSSSSNRKSFDKGDKPRTSSASVEKTSGGGGDAGSKRRVNCMRYVCLA